MNLRSSRSRSGVVSCTEVDGSCTILTANECFGGSSLFNICQEEQSLYQSEDWCVLYVLSRAEMLEVRRHVKAMWSIGDWSMAQALHESRRIHHAVLKKGQEQMHSRASEELNITSTSELQSTAEEVENADDLANYKSVVNYYYVYNIL